MLVITDQLILILLTNSQYASTMASFYHNYQNPSVCSFLGLLLIKLESKNEMNSGSCSQIPSSRKWPTSKRVVRINVLLILALNIFTSSNMFF